MNWKKIKAWLPFIGIILFIIIMIKLDISQIFNEIKNINFNYLLLAFLIVPFFYILQTLKWFILAKKQKIDVSFKESFKINLISAFYGFITPGKLGTVIRANYLKKKGSSIGKGLSNFSIDKMLDLFSLFAMIIIFGMVVSKNILSLNYKILISTFFGILILLFFIFYNKNNTKTILSAFYNKLIPDRLKEKSKNLFNSFYQNLPSFSSLFLSLLINIITWISYYFIIYFIAISLGIKVSFFYFLIILPISTLVAQIPITIDGFGTRELTLIGLFGILGVESVKVFSMSLLGIILTGVIPSIIAIILIIMERKK